MDRFWSSFGLVYSTVSMRIGLGLVLDIYLALEP